MLLYTLDVDGAVFEVRRHEGGTDYDWINHAHGGYGFGSSAKHTTEAEDREAIGFFLRDIDRGTGYLRED